MVICEPKTSAASRCATTHCADDAPPSARAKPRAVPPKSLGFRLAQGGIHQQLRHAVHAARTGQRMFQCAAVDRRTMRPAPRHRVPLHDRRSVLPHLLRGLGERRGDLAEHRLSTGMNRLSRAQHGQSARLRARPLYKPLAIARGSPLLPEGRSGPRGGIPTPARSTLASGSRSARSVRSRSPPSRR
jgi:hypothetical protein